MEPALKIEKSRQSKLADRRSHRVAMHRATDTDNADLLRTISNRLQPIHLFWGQRVQGVPKIVYATTELIIINVSTMS